MYAVASEFGYALAEPPVAARECPDRQKFVSLSDAWAYALGLPKSQQDAPHVQAGIAVLLLAAGGKFVNLQRRQPPRTSFTARRSRSRAEDPIGHG